MHMCARYLATLFALLCPAATVLGQQPGVCSDLAARMGAIGSFCTPSQTSCGPSCAGVLLSTFDECALDSATQARWGQARVGCSGSAAVNGQGSTSSGGDWLKGDCRAGGTSSCLNGATCVLREQGHHRRQQDGEAAGGRRLCSPDTLPKRTTAVNAACCTTAPADDCANGLPTTCSAECAQVLVPFQADCIDTLSKATSNWQAVSAALQRVVETCAPPPPPPAGPGPLGPSYHRCTCPLGFAGKRCDEPSGAG